MCSMYDKVGLSSCAGEGRGVWPGGVSGPSEDEIVSREAKEGTRLNACIERAEEAGGTGSLLVDARAGAFVSGLQGS